MRRCARWSGPGLGVLVVVLALGGGCGDEGRPGPAADATTAQRIATLRAVLLPPPGTRREDVDTAYGAPRQADGPPGKGRRSDYPMHVYTLLAPREAGPDRASLHVTYRDGLVVRAGINHLVETKGRTLGPRSAAEQAQYAGEQGVVLKDLEEIVERFRPRLREAPWSQRPAGR